ncbi:MAG: hypothetical protein RLZZ450_3442 [Pseudomonadota bacterium]
MHTARLLTERSFESLLASALAARVEGLVVLRCREGLRHGVWVEGGYVVGAHVAGRFDPLLELLLRTGSLSLHAHRSCIEALHQTGERAGSVAQNLGGVTTPLLSDALKLQIAQRFVALLEVAASAGHDAQLESRSVPDSERSVRLPLGSLQRRVARLAAQRGLAGERGQHDARRALRTLARALHPDLNAHLDDETRQRLSGELARATAVYHGFG